ncbi:hypothetical protein ALC62_13702 [Cyphomyrmex costatus]|uniref:Uncharacterized protein n=1 Tax=Cyphomyrmex costatus TaxID=456900 RepID=A0A195C402_9HYME|nr:hypothetical protein ALC62_13702 [Cyphomyrmex costatus]
MIQKTRAPDNIPKRFPGPSLQNAGARNAHSKWGPVAHSGARRRLVSLTIVQTYSFLFHGVLLLARALMTARHDPPGKILGDSQNIRDNGGLASPGVLTIIDTPRNLHPCSIR